MWVWEARLRSGLGFWGCCRRSFFRGVSGHIWVLISGAFFVAEMLISWGFLAAARKQLVSARLSFLLLS